jgi:hypothetical protein
VRRVSFLRTPRLIITADGITRIFIEDTTTDILTVVITTDTVTKTITISTVPGSKGLMGIIVIGKGFWRGRGYVARSTFFEITRLLEWLNHCAGFIGHPNDGRMRPPIEFCVTESRGCI